MLKTFGGSSLLFLEGMFTKKLQLFYKVATESESRKQEHKKSSLVIFVYLSAPVQIVLTLDSR